MAVLYGVFLYMGTSSLKGSQVNTMALMIIYLTNSPPLFYPQFFKCILIILMLQKYQPDYVFFCHVPTYKVHIFTLTQVLCFALL